MLIYYRKKNIRIATCFEFKVKHKQIQIVKSLRIDFTIEEYSGSVSIRSAFLEDVSCESAGKGVESQGLVEIMGEAY